MTKLTLLKSILFMTIFVNFLLNKTRIEYRVKKEKKIN